MSTKPWWNQQFPPLSSGIPGGFWVNQALVQNAIRHGGGAVFNNQLTGNLREATFEQVVAQFEALGLRTVLSSPMWRGDNCTKAILIREDACVELAFNDGDLEGAVITTDRTLFDKGQEILEKYIGPRVSAGRAYVMVSNPDGSTRLESIGTAAVPLERGNYNPDVIEDFDHVVNDLKSSDPTGRLAIFDGNPGTGKTYMIRGLLGAVQEALFVFVPVGMVAELANPSLVGSLIEIKRNKGDAPMVFVIEDADNCLGTRDAGNVNHVSALLNLGDGILGSMLDIRVVCTTNLKDDELDEAIIRPGRLSRKIHVGRLNQLVASDLFERLTGKRERIREDLTLAQVYSRAKDAGWKPPVKIRRSVGFQPVLSPSEFMGLREEGVSPSDLMHVLPSSIRD